MKLSHLLAGLPQYQILAQPEAWSNRLDISHISENSRNIKAGGLFVAYQGVARNGHAFIPQALANGAVAIVVEDNQPVSLSQRAMVISVPNGREALAYLAAAWHDYPARKLTMVGITGTDGKTTTTNYLYHILKQSSQSVSMISTVNVIIGDRVLETGLHTTTPDAPEVQRYLAEMTAAGIDTCLLETTSHGLAQHRVTACDFDLAVVTNITHDHLDIHGSVAAYRSAKAQLFASLATATPKGIAKKAILNCDDWSFDYLKEKLEVLGVAWLGYSIAAHPQATVSAHNIVCRADKTTFTIQGANYEVEAETSLIGDYNVSNCLAAATAAIEGLGIAPQVAKRGIAALPGVPGRMERIDQGQPFVAVVDFAHTPNSLRRALTTARSLTTGRVIAVFGCAGLRDVTKRSLMGHIAAELADLTLITAEDPRTENLEAIIDQTAQAMLERGAIEGQHFERIPDRGRAIYRATQLAQADDMVLALGKGHEQSMCFAETEYPWDDRQALRSALQGKPLLTLPTASSQG